MRRARVLALLSLLVAGLPAAAETIIPLQTRPPSEAEVKTFHAYYQRRFPDDPSAQPVFTVTRPHVDARWDVTATVNMAPRRGLKLLCRMQRLEFAYAAASGQWRADDHTRQFVWLGRASGCEIPDRPVELLQRMPDTELTAVLAQQATLLDKARLLMAGNSDCARYRSLPFTLLAIDVGASGSSSEEMVALNYRTAPDVDATIWARRSGASYDPWSAACGRTIRPGST
ncbi:hypothetical protein INH39_22115 [Massilia violaceinigra]|uniref:Uncharacterized protein n=1 Tax=Massilia violaceinigra TaxID=2045208 RepID=A0ABY4A071_9BURK|nr:DUF2610 domain-containing protein [Massilia violaceinigra]UOD28146.1 hypothetical protein INH39_22115 [Massilia violaceinigra]